ncbi:MAG: formate--tetrahydrofolate ligase [Acidobacteriota bacterium]|nr:formate--tetrahydrofolate ligase [Acidobacteriota bacterium]MDH3524071.1 formate--tetrahydrofolate ligase [Acidobacteriota bacterium]
MSSVRPITEVARDLGIGEEHLVPYGSDKAKVRLAAAANGRPRGRLVLVSAITPTSAGEGKTTTSIGLAQGLAKIGESVCLALREPSLGPTFGKKGGATGGGRSIVVPTVDINLHFTGDFHAITSANNLLAAMLDNHVYHHKSPKVDPRRVLWRRVIDLNDRALRHTIVGLGGKLEGVPRETGFDITPASEVMAILCLAEGEADLRARLGRILVGFTYDDEPVVAADLKAVGAMMVLLRDALMPNLVQTIEGVPAFIHGGPFANIAHGCNSVLATKMALAHADWVITEAGFGFDLGAEKFFDIKCQSADLDAAAVVLVATVRALKRHGGVPQKKLGDESPQAVAKGLPNLHKHIQNIQAFGEIPIVALNRFSTDTEAEVDVVRRACAEAGVPFAVSDHFERGGEGAMDLARTLCEHCEQSPSRFRPLYDWSEPIPTKIEKVARTMYGASEVVLSKLAETQIKRLTELGYGGLPVCIAKAPTSLTDDPRIAGRPEGFDVTVRSMELAAGAGFVIPLLGDVMRMPGLPLAPQAEVMDLVDGETVGLMGA